MKLLNQYILLGLCLTTTLAFAQVGIGTVSPSATLTIDSGSDPIAALELVPQAVPTTNLADGQLAVINGNLYMYDDSVRNSWLSVETVALQFGRNGNVDTDNLHFGGNMVSGVSGALMPSDGTIVAITAMAASGADTNINIRARDAAGTNSIDETFSLASLRYTDNTANLQFSAGEYITARARDAATTATDVTVVIWVKWRQ